MERRMNECTRERSMVECKKLGLFCGISSPTSLWLFSFYSAFDPALLPRFLSRIKAATAVLLHLTSFKSPFRGIRLW